MKNIKFKTTIYLLFIGILFSNAQKFEKDFSKEISYTDKEVILNANYADIEIKEWNKKKIKISATMIVEGVSEEIAQSYFDSWKIDIKDNDKVRIISKSNNHFPRYLNLETDFDFNFDFEPMILEMPEISLESLNVLDSMDFNFPELNFSEVFNDSIFSKRFKLINFSKLDSLPNGVYFANKGKLNTSNLKETQEYLREWKANNKDYILALEKRSKELTIRHQKKFQQRMKSIEKRKEMIEKRQEMIEKMKKVRKNNLVKAKKVRAKERKKLKESRAKIKAIIKNRDKAKVRTKLIIRVPKGTDINMNVNYSKVNTN